ncbi:zinc finger CCCH domain-containing protein 55-like [Phalaenopsis equestris]|uniref:zinc finger CCCH domain-containing protein 55-like n=1 Tax=Phalaenopsis equestris TaxID=78828 RepID=UPI0009E21895|nr:zinc finger CCCH domain-containing protein 55-like [Phalaenopsis equestris]XP_020593979.1 zinc finger CCCH domain-containing protein 55-like [Phalaenopsis equestris]XP_020593980.1 zinc finger CCCH domain-containing protein 55-like [Phalaenopsis equestris]XP_020593981.1 zinc finger CCCH domain-containing protein 55-like [Phalaenopsis equestris]
MAEKMKKRISKWDMAAEQHVEAVVHGSDLPTNVDDPVMDLTEVDSIKPILSMNVGVSEINQSANQSGEERISNIIHSDDIFEKTRYSERLDLEGGCKDDRQPVSQDTIMAEYAENQDRPPKAAYDMSPGYEEKHRSNRIVSQIDDRSRSHRSRSRSRGRSRSRSRSLPYDSRSRSWSKSPSYISKQGSDRWTDKGRMRRMTPPCRAFAAGQCRWGTECRFLHEAGDWRQIDRHHDAGSNDGRGSRLERESRPPHGENLTDPREKDNYTHEKPFRRHEENLGDGLGNNVPYQGYRSNERCYDFTIGRCNRGAACRYIHHDASSDSGRSSRDELRGRVHDRRDGNVSFGHRIEHRRSSDVPCKYFLRGYCLHGDGCKFRHQVGPLNSPVEGSFDGSHHNFVSGDKQNFTNRPQSQPVPTQDFHKETQSSEQKTRSKVSEELSANNPLPTISIAGQNTDISGQIQFAPQLSHAQNFASNSSFQQFAPSPLKGQIQQVMPSHSQNGNNQLGALHKPPDDQSFNAGMQNLSANPPSYQLNPQNLESRAQAQQNLPMISHSVSNINLNKPIQQNGQLTHNPHNQPDLSVGGHIQQNLSSHIGHSDSQQILQASLNPQIFNSNEKISEIPTKNDPIQIGQAADSIEVKPSTFSSDNSIAHKVVTSEQAAKITDLSASLAQFFGTAVHNSQPSSSMTPPSFLNPSSMSSFMTAVAPPPTEAEGSQTNPSQSTSKPDQQKHVIENFKQVNDSSSKEAKKIDKGQQSQLQNGDAEGRKDKIKEVKEMRMFKCALVEFVKDILKPKWKEGQLSKEAHKSIVKKVVDKVCGSMQGSNVPQTQEKIDLYLLNSKAKLSKLVQAYVEKFVNS